MALLSIGTDHSAAPLADLARFDHAQRAIRDALLRGGAPLDGAIVLGTCNRFEVYADTAAPDIAADGIITGIAQQLRIPRDRLSAQLRVRRGDDAVRHLLSVASGLESMIIGDHEIAGQVRRALAAAQRRGTVTSHLNALFQFAATVAKRVGAGTGIGTTGRTVIETMLDLAAERAGGLGGRTVLLIGTGAYARVVLAVLAERGTGEVAVHSRSGRAAAFARDRGACPIGDDDLTESLARADLVVGASGAHGVVVDRALATNALRMRNPGRPLVCADIALSRDIAPDVGDLPGVDLLDLDDVRSRAPRAHAAEIAAARRIVDEAADEFADRQRARRSDAIVVALREHLADMIAAEVESVRRVDAGRAEAVARSLSRVGNALLHTPTVRAKRYAAAGKHAEFAHAVEALFDLEGRHDA